ncbi:hypothetical protein J2T10_002737 [Paenarthrobacter nicotinovorans]|uniref:Uncharacterized protein n=1 Tax=Paenarthrobacter nicotinovorans TaxID=29320 RepID=A0ABT9TNV9_PAENI|nr:hypothetical protein [Paenarthrobacter nicotinovorans]MDQ0103080.1 hypothetical protein [Paenarthrobacter nicotinovorans]GAT88408.1 hypothetical protein CVCC1112_3067 [Paenarthrobacter nicotinovorans]
MKTKEMPNLLGPAVYEKGEKLAATKWGILESGNTVLVQREGEPLLPGEVDLVHLDACVFWVWLKEGRGRIVIYPYEGTYVWLPPQ